MHNIYLRCSKYIAFFIVSLVFFCQDAQAQLTVTTAQPAATLASTLAGPGVTTFGATLTCPGVANGIFTSTGTLLSMSSGIVLTNGHAAACSGAEPPLTSFTLGTAGDASVAAAIGTPLSNTYDACVLEFNVVATTDTIGFNYQLGSEEYRTAVCSPYNDAFGFFISGPGIVGAPNIALVPGTNIPVEINSVNNGIPGTSGGVLSNCTSLGAGCPFTSLYLDNTGGTLLAYRGYTKKFRAFHTVTPCDTYHLKLAIVDVGNAIYDSGVFLEAASLTGNSFSFNRADSIGATINGIPHSIVKGCNPATVHIIASHSSPTPTTINILSSGTAVSGVDVSGVPTSVVLPADSTNVSFNVSGIPTPPGGTKTITFYLSSACGIADSITLNVMDTPSARILTLDTTICPGGSGLIRVSGTTGLQYNWSPGTGLSSTTVMQPTATPATTTTYTMTATLPNSGCPSIVKHVTFTVINTTISMFTHDTSICSGNSDNLQVNGDPTLNYSWTPTTGLSNPSIQNPTATPSATTTYVVTATGPGGICPSTATVTITVSNVTASIVTPDTTECSGTTFLLRTTGTAGMTYTWAPGTGLSSTTIPDPTATPTVTTTYTMTATLPGSGCAPIVKSVTVIVVNNQIVIQTPDTTVCKGDTVRIRVIGSSTLAYTWTPGYGLSAYDIQNPFATPTITTTYSVTAVTPDLGCPTSAHFTITVEDPMAIILTPDTSICRGDSIQLRINTGGTYTYHWSPATAVSDSVAPQPFVLPTVMTTYTLSTTTPIAHCAAQADVTVAVAGSGAVEFNNSDSVLCVGTDIAFIAKGSVGTSSYVWNFGDADTVIDANPVIHSYTAPGTYTVTITAYYAGCPDSVKSKVVNIYAYPALDLGPDASICPGSDPILIYDKINGTASNATWRWNTGATTSSIYVSTPGLYYAIVSIKGCTTTDSVWVADDCYMDVPNAFTPNGDGINDYFFPRQQLTKGLINFHMSIFNRWGELIFETSALDGRGWDGNFNNVPQPEGVFIYVIDGVFKDGQKEHHQGNITLLR